MEEDKSFFSTSEPINHSDDNNHGWQKVTAKKQRKNQNKKPAVDSSKLPNGSAIAPEKNTVFKGLEKHAEERRRKLEAQRAAAVYDDDDYENQGRSRNNRGRDEYDDDLSSDADVKNNAVEVKKKEKQKKVKQPKVTVSEAAAKIDADDLTAFLSSVSVFLCSDWI